MNGVLDDYVFAASTANTTTFTLYWKWDIGAAADNASDTALGTKDTLNEITASFKVVATQSTLKAKAPTP